MGRAIKYVAVFAAETLAALGIFKAVEHIAPRMKQAWNDRKLSRYQRMIRDGKL